MIDKILSVVAAEFPTMEVKEYSINGLNVNSVDDLENPNEVHLNIKLVPVEK